MGKNKNTDQCCEYKDDILKRLRRVEGQIKGIQKMIEEEKYCVDILTQIAAVRAAINRVGGIILQKHSKTCLQGALEADKREEALDDLVDTIQKFLKFVD
ncbi:MAG: metal-sensitive transcriptional regulator [Bacillota bacterium]